MKSFHKVSWTSDSLGSLVLWAGSLRLFNLHSIYLKTKQTHNIEKTKQQLQQKQQTKNLNESFL